MNNIISCITHYHIYNVTLLREGDGKHSMQIKIYNETKQRFLIRKIQFLRIWWIQAHSAKILTKSSSLFNRKNISGRLILVATIFVKTRTFFTKRTFNSEKPGNILKDYLLSFSYCLTGEEFNFMQDSAAVHGRKNMKQWFSTSKVDSVLRSGNV